VTVPSSPPHPRRDTTSPHDRRCLTHPGTWGSVAALALAAAVTASVSCSETASGAAGDPNGSARLVLAGEPVARRVWASAVIDPLIRPAFDGRKVAYIDWATGDVALHDLVDGTDRRLTNAVSGSATGDFADAAVASPNGTLVAYAWWDGTVNRFDLKLVDVVGGGVKTLQRNPVYQTILPLAWSRDSRRIAVALPKRDGALELGVVDLDGRLVVVPWTTRLGALGAVQFAHDTTTLLVDVRRGRQRTDSFDVVAADVASGRSWPVVTHPADDRLAGLTANGDAVLFFSDRDGTTSLYAQPVTSDARPAGQPLAVKRDVWSGVGVGTTTAGSLLYTIQTGVQTLYAVQLDPATGAAGVPRPLAPAGNITRAPVADWIAGGTSTIQNFRPGRGHAGTALTVRSVLSGDTREVVTPLVDVNTLHASPDGTHVLANGRDGTNRSGVYVVDVRTGGTRAIAVASFDSALMVRTAGWSEDSRSAYYTVEEFRRDRLRLVAHDISGGSERTVLELPCTAGCAGRVSPDGGLFAMVQGAPADASVMRVVVTPTGGRGEPREVARVIAPQRLVGAPAWTPDGRTLIIATSTEGGDPRTTRFLIAHADGTAPRAAAVAVAGPVTGVRVHPDGRQILFLAGESVFELWSLDHLQFRRTR
jgi:Tol biopolymer transport system component